jgi:hypothetical protein
MDNHSNENEKWESIFFTNEETSFLFGTSAETGSKLLKKSLAEATQWLLDNNVDHFNISHDISIQKPWLRSSSGNRCHRLFEKKS